MTTAYVYKWTHLPTMMWYVGSRTRKNCHPNDGYICSSKLIKPLILKNIHEWKRDIIDFGTVEEMFDLESQILQKILNPLLEMPKPISSNYSSSPNNIGIQQQTKPMSVSSVFEPKIIIG